MDKLNTAMAPRRGEAKGAKMISDEAKQMMAEEQPERPTNRGSNGRLVLVSILSTHQRQAVI
jgi:hypothetical protein